HVEVEGPHTLDVQDAPVVADGDVAAGQGVEHQIPCDITTRPTLTTKLSWKTTRPITAPMPSGPLSSMRPTATTVITPRRLTLLVPTARRSALRLVSASSVRSLAMPESRKRRFT